MLVLRPSASLIYFAAMICLSIWIEFVLGQTLLQFPIIPAAFIVERQLKA